MRSYLTLCCRLPSDREEALTQVLESWPVLGCQVEDARPDILVTVFMDASHADDFQRISGELLLLGAREMVSGPFADRDWLAEYREHVRPVAIGERFWIDPNPAAPTPPPGDAITSSSSRAAPSAPALTSPRDLSWRSSSSSTVRGARVLDVGCGSGILALAACALGAASAVGFDIDSEAVFVARQTVRCQPAAQPVLLYAGSVASLAYRARFDLILANLIPAEFSPFLAELAALLTPDGTLVLSGLMVDQRLVVESELAAVGLAVQGHLDQEEWVALLCRRA